MTCSPYHSFNEIIRVIEEDTCNYSIIVHSPLLCDHPLFMVESKLGLSGIQCSPVLSEVKYNRYMAFLNKEGKLLLSQMKWIFMKMLHVHFQLMIINLLLRLYLHLAGLPIGLKIYPLIVNIYSYEINHLLATHRVKSIDLGGSFPPKRVINDTLEYGIGKVLTNKHP